jgi:hypothetical protein
MDYKNILKSELARSDVVETDAYDVAPGNSSIANDLLNDCEHLLSHVPSMEDIQRALVALCYPAGDSDVRLVPIRTYLQTYLRVSSQRLEDLINDNEWIHSWIEHIRALQEVKIVEEFGAGNMEDSRFKWLMWGVLGEGVDLVSGRMGASTGADAVLRDMYVTEN